MLRFRLELRAEQVEEEKKEKEIEKIRDSNGFYRASLPSAGIELDDFNETVAKKTKNKKKRKDSSNDDTEILPKRGYQVTWNSSRKKYIKIREVWYDQKLC